MHPASPSAPRLFAAAAFVASAVACLALLAFLEMLSPSLPFRLPAWVLLLCTPFVCVCAAILLLPRSRQRWMAPTGIAAVAVAVVLLLTPWNPRKRFFWTVHGLAPGMTLVAVEERMQPYLRNAEPSRVDASFDGTLFWRWNARDGSYDADVGAVTFVRGRVVAVRSGED